MVLKLKLENEMESLLIVTRVRRTTTWKHRYMLQPRFFFSLLPFWNLYRENLKTSLERLNALGHNPKLGNHIS